MELALLWAPACLSPSDQAIVCGLLFWVPVSRLLDSGSYWVGQAWTPQDGPAHQPTGAGKPEATAHATPGSQL